MNPSADSQLFAITAGPGLTVFSKLDQKNIQIANSQIDSFNFNVELEGEEGVCRRKMSLTGVVALVYGGDEEGRRRAVARLEKLKAVVDSAVECEDFGEEYTHPRITHVLVLQESQNRLTWDCKEVLERYPFSFVVTEKWLDCCEIQGRRAIELEYLLQDVQMDVQRASQQRLSVLSSEIVATPSVNVIRGIPSQEAENIIPIPGVRSASPWEDYGRPSQLSPSPQLFTRSRLREKVDQHILNNIRKASGNAQEEARASKRNKHRDRDGAQLEERPAVCPDSCTDRFAGGEGEGEGEVHIVAQVRCVEPALSDRNKSDPSTGAKPHRSRTRGYVALSSIEPLARKDLSKTFERLKGFVLVKDVHQCQKITHLILGSEKRTAKVLLAIVSGAWFLSSKWVHDSKRNGHWLEESEYEVQGGFAQAAQRARAANKAGLKPLCKMLKIHLFGGKADHRKSLKQLCTAMGALVTTRAKCDVSIWCDNPSSHKEEEEEGIRNKPVLHQEWILKSAQDYQLHPLKMYQVENLK